MGAAAFAGALWLTRPPGPGLTPDGMSYLGAAESWASGRGLRIPYAAWTDPDSTSPLKLFAPGYPVAIGVTVKLGAAPAQGARVLQALAAGAGAAALAWLLDLLAGALAAAVGCAAIFLAPAIFGDYIAVLSEPLFLACLSVTLLLVVARPDRPLEHGLAAAAAATLRYAGLALVAATVLWALASPGGRRARLGRAARAAAPGLVLVLAWLARTWRVAHGAPLAVERPSFALLPSLNEAWTTAALSLAPGLGDTRWLHPVAVAASLLAVLALTRVRFAPAEVGARTLRRFTLLFALCYLLTVVLAKALVGHDIPLDERILSPLVLCGALLLTIALAHGLTRWPARLSAAAGLAALLWFTGAGLTAARLVRDIADGYDFGLDVWRISPTLAWLRREGAGHALFANHPVPIYYYLHRPSRDLPTSADPDTLRRFAATFGSRPSLLVAFSDTTWRWQLPGEQLARDLGLRVAARLSDGTIWASGPAVSAGSSSH